jgi:hypothetical protein
MIRPNCLGRSRRPVAAGRRGPFAAISICCERHPGRLEGEARSWPESRPGGVADRVRALQRSEFEDYVVHQWSVLTLAIDTVRRQFYPADLASDRPVDFSQAEPIAPDKVRRYESSGDSLVVTYLDAAAKPAAVARWHRSAPR